jgi:tyrosinase
MAFHLQMHILAFLWVLLLIANVDATCVNPSVRREWRQLSTDERTAWISAVKCLSALPHDSALTPSVDPTISLIPAVNATSSFWDDISYMHMDLNWVIHFTGFFLPWHRTFVWGVTNAMKEKCGYDGVAPYWDWTIDAPDFSNSTLFQEDDPDSGLGGWGDPNNDYEITTGGFASGFPLSYPSPHSLRREMTLQPFLSPPPFPLPPGPGPTSLDEYINSTFTLANAEYMVDNFVGNYTGFQAYFESIDGVHPGPHTIIGGDMSGLCPNTTVDCYAGPKWTPNEPLFFMHHAMVDKIWYDWQLQNEANFYAFHGGSASPVDNATLYSEYPNGGPPFLNFSSVIPNDGLLWDNVTIGDVMNTTNDLLCYVYE